MLPRGKNWHGHLLLCYSYVLFYTSSIASLGSLTLTELHATVEANQCYPTRVNDQFRSGTCLHRFTNR